MDLHTKISKEIQFKDNFAHIPYKDKIARAYEELLDTDPNKIMKRWRNEWDSMLGGIYGWKVYAIGANTWVGKSTFVSQVCNNVSNQWWRVVKYSLEDRMEDIGKEDIFYMVNRLRKKDKQKWYWWVDFINWKLNDDEEFKTYLYKACDILIEKNNLVELDKTKQVSIEDLIKLMEEECKKGTKLFVVDHLHYFDMKNDERHDLQIQNVMHRINEIARKNNVAVFIVAHYRKGSNDMQPNPDEFKDGSAIKQVANIIIQITRDFELNESEFHITKMRWPIRPQTLRTKFNLETYEYEFTKSEQSKENIWWEYF